MKNLEQFIKDNNKFFRLTDGEEWTGQYLGYNIGIDRFNPEKEIANYKLKSDGAEKAIFWGTGRIDVAQFFSKVKPGSRVKITRTGSDKSDTSYDMKVIKDSVSPIDSDYGDAQEE